ncbi:MAG: HAD-IIB family hydrolase [Candidatus Thermoplasmatota archaeon]|nr:HAD-IIB family hydrolase [Candidatus Thermoplasmatota archaeon]
MKIVYSDLDGTLLDHDTYSYAAAKKGLDWLKKQNVPIVFCTSKTREEIVYWKQEMENVHPFISENGGGIFIPHDYFSFPFDYTKKTDSFYLIRFGAPFHKLKKTINQIEKEFDVTSFLSMSVSELTDLADLSKKDAQRALNREFDIPFIMHNQDQKNDIIKVIKNNKLNIVEGGRFFHLVGENDKGKAVSVLTSLFHQVFDTVETIGIGDSANDFSMLQAVDKPFLVMKKDQSFASKKFPHTKGIGPVGWQLVIENEFDL